MTNNYNTRPEETQEQNVYNDNFRNQYPPAQVGGDAYNRAIARNLEESRIGAQQVQSSYADMFNRNRRQNYNHSMMGAPQGVTGGMKNQYQGAVSATQMSAANQLGVQQERSLRDVDLNRMSMDRAAVQEGYQAEDRARQTQMYDMQMEQQRQAILDDENMTDDQKMRMLMAGGMDYASAAEQVQPQAEGDNFAQRLASGEVNPTGLALGTAGTVATGAMAIKALPATSKFAGLIFSDATTRSVLSSTLKKVSYKSILKGSTSLFSKSAGGVAGKAVASTNSKLAANFGFKLPKVVGVLSKFAVAHPAVAIGVGAAIAIGLGYSMYKNNKEQETTDYSTMMPATG